MLGTLHRFPTVSHTQPCCFIHLQHYYSTATGAQSHTRACRAQAARVPCSSTGRTVGQAQEDDGGCGDCVAALVKIEHLCEVQHAAVIASLNHLGKTATCITSRFGQDLIHCTPKKRTTRNNHRAPRAESALQRGGCSACQHSQAAYALPLPILVAAGMPEVRPQVKPKTMSRKAKATAKKPM